MTNEKLISALKYQSIGLSIIPTGANKKPLIEWKPYQDRCATIQEITNWWSIWPNANPALVTGKISGLVALDLDKKYNRTSKEFTISPTACARSGNGGEHFFFKYPKNISIKSGSAIIGDGVDCRGDGGYILLAPSVNETGGKYEWIISIADKNDIADMPEWFIELTKSDQKDKKWLSGKDGVSEGSRNETASSMTGKILHDLSFELWDTAGWDSLLAWNKRNLKPLEEKELRGVFESIKKYHNSDKSKESKNLLLEDICNRKDVTLFCDEQSDAYISIEIAGHQETLPCRSKAIKRLLANKSWERDKKPLGSEAIKNILAVLEGKACFEGPKIKLHNRVAWYENNLWYDLTNEKWEAIKISNNGWQIVSKPPIIFKRYSHNKPQVIPSPNGDLKLFLNYVNISDPEHRLLFLVYLITCFLPDFPHVMLVVFGSQGSSKSTLLKLIRLLVDPSIIDIASFPHSQKELIQILAHHYFLPFDNVSYISEEQSDTLCKAITGGGHSKRELYENDEDIIYSFMRCIGINGINLVTTRPDLLERSLLLELSRIEDADRKTEKELYEKFIKDLPCILGGVFDVLEKAIQIYPTIKLDTHPRMADWSLWGCAITEALGYKKENFLSAYKNNMVRQTEMLLNENIVATAVITFMEDYDEWRGSPTKLYDEICSHAMLKGIDTREKYWPKGVNALSKRLNELNTPLKQMGYLVIISTSGTERWIHIKKLIKTDDTDDLSQELHNTEPVQKELSSF